MIRIAGDVAISPAVRCCAELMFVAWLAALIMSWLFPQRTHAALGLIDTVWQIGLVLGLVVFIIGDPLTNSLGWVVFGCVGLGSQPPSAGGRFRIGGRSWL